MLSVLLGGLFPAAIETYLAKSTELRLPGPRTRRRRSKKTPELELIHWRVGYVAVQVNRRLVFIVQAHKVVDDNIVAATLNTNPWFAVGSGSRDLVAWHACRLAHRCSLMFPPEAPCERIGSLMRLLWEPRQKMGAVAVADRVYLSQAGVVCVGSDRDELLVEVVSDLLKSTSKYRVGARGRTSGALPLLLQDKQRALEDSGRFAGSMPFDAQDLLEPDLIAELCKQGRRNTLAGLRQRESAGSPKDLPEAVQVALQRASHGETVIPLPTDVLTLRAEQRGAAGSVTKARARQWLESDAGREWLKERAKIFAADDDVDGEAACPLGVEAASSSGVGSAGSGISGAACPSRARKRARQ